MAPIAQGSDDGGSICIPAAFCGIYGIKPTFVRIPHGSRPDVYALHTPYFSELGPMAHTVEDAALMLDVMAGPLTQDPFSHPTTDTDYLGATCRSIDGLRIGFSPILGDFPVADAVQSVVEDAVEALETAGRSISSVTPDLGYPQLELVKT